MLPNHSPATRRSFLTTTAAGAASVWIPKPVKGYSGGEVRAASEEGTLTVGMSKWDLDTPALCVDLDAMEASSGS